jgi:dihydropteroate synthase
MKSTDRNLALSGMLSGPPPWLMGVVNITPDSFSDGGLHLSPSSAVKAVNAQHSAGAAVIDIGGESTRPGSKHVPAEEELRRVEPAVLAAAKLHVLSIDTYKAKVARRCLELGARMVNDVSALRADPEMGRTVADHGAFVVLMHNKQPPDKPHASDTPRAYKNVVAELCDFFKERIDAALKDGIAINRIIIDPGVGMFLSHDPAYSWEVLERFEEFTALGLPLLIGTSRKGFLGLHPEDRDPLSALTSLAAAAKGAAILRVHNVAMAGDFIRAAREMKLLSR